MTIVSFSGIDGAGKSTQIFELQAWLRESGLGVKLLTFWDDIVPEGKQLDSESGLAQPCLEFENLRALTGTVDSGKAHNGHGIFAPT